MQLFLCLLYTVRAATLKSHSPSRAELEQVNHHHPPPRCTRFHAVVHTSSSVVNLLQKLLPIPSLPHSLCLHTGLGITALVHVSYREFYPGFCDPFYSVTPLAEAM